MKLLGFYIVLCCCLVIGCIVMTIKTFKASQESLFWVAHTQEVLQEINGFTSAVRDVQIGGRDYLVTRDTKFTVLVSHAEASIDQRIKKIHELTVDNKIQQRRVDSISVMTAMRSKFTELYTPAELEKNLSESEGFMRLALNRQFEDQILRLGKEMQSEEQRLLARRKELNAGSEHTSDRVLFVLIASLVVCLALIMINVRKNAKLQMSIVRNNHLLEKKIKEASDYKYALDESSIVAVTDRHGSIIHVNANFTRITKFEKEEILGNSHRIINSSWHPAGFFQAMWATINNGMIWKGEIKNAAKDGTTYWVDVTIVPFKDRSGVPYQFLEIGFDITERKLAEELNQINQGLKVEILDKTAELASIFERITDGFIVIDREFMVTYANRRIGEMTSMPVATITGKWLWDVFPNAVGSDTFSFLKKAMEENTYQFHVDYNPQFDLWQENYIYPTEKGLSVFVRDITLQKRAEEKLIKSEGMYKNVVSHIPGSVICLLDRDLRYFLVEGDVIDILGKLGYDKSNLLGNRLEDVVTPERYKALSHNFTRVFNGEIFSVDTSQGAFDYSTRYVPLKNENNEVYAAMLLLIDITEIRGAERRIAELNEGLEEKISFRTRQLALANKDLEAFSYSVAHDLRTPLRAIAGYSEMLSEDYSNQFDSEGRRLLGELQRNNKKMGNLIDDLLAFSRLGRKAINYSEIDMKTMVESIWHDFKLQGAKLITHEMLSVNADASLIRHVLTNILSNAVKYSSKSKSPCIHITSTSTNGMITYSISDNGVGFDMAYAGNLFGVFQRLHRETDFDGTGVGLAIVQRIITRHGGKVWAEGKINHGATFYFSLPIEPALNSVAEFEIDPIQYATT